MIRYAMVKPTVRENRIEKDREVKRQLVLVVLSSPLTLWWRHQISIPKTFFFQEKYFVG
jgi:hypothetical protein